jgi:ketosteroid isomerase-like protein
MKSTIVVLALILATSDFGQSTTEAKARAVAQRDRDLNALIIKHDAAARDFYDDQFVLTTSSGKTKTMDVLLPEIINPTLSFEANETSDVSVRVRDDTALLTAVLHQKGVSNGKPFDLRFHVTDTWVFEDGNWRLLGGHASAL